MIREPLAVLEKLQQRMRQELADFASGRLTQIWSKTVYEWADDLASVIRGIKEQDDPLTTFAREVLDGYRTGVVGDVDGGWLQDKAIELGLLVPASGDDDDPNYYIAPWLSGSPSLVTRQREDEKNEKDTRVDGERRAAGPTGSTAASNEAPPTWRE